MIDDIGYVEQNREEMEVSLSSWLNATNEEA